MSRTEALQRITRRLIIMTSAALLIVGFVFGAGLFLGSRLEISWLCFGCGLIGGFVSIQQRLKKLGDEELDLLVGSFFQILLIPVYGGIFSLVLYLGFLGDIISGAFFPHFSILPFSKPFPKWQDLVMFLSTTCPASGQDFAKLLFWSFVAGFSERLVPQLIGKSQSSPA